MPTGPIEEAGLFHRMLENAKIENDLDDMRERGDTVGYDLLMASLGSPAPTTDRQARSSARHDARVKTKADAKRARK